TIAPSITRPQGLALAIAAATLATMVAAPAAGAGTHPQTTPAASTRITATQFSNLQIQVTTEAQGGVFKPGTSVTYDIRVTNGGTVDAPAKAIRVKFVLSDVLGKPSSFNNPGWVDLCMGTHFGSTLELQAGRTAILRITARIDPKAKPGQFINS